MTRCRVGATGAGVPTPSMTNRTNACSKTTTPGTRITYPTTAMISGGPATPPPVSPQGTSPATTPGSTTRKSRLPAAALRRASRGWSPFSTAPRILLERACRPRWGVRAAVQRRSGERDVAELPAPVEVRLQRAVEAEVGEPVAAGDGLPPVALAGGRRVRAEGQVDRAVVVGDQFGVA